MSSSSVTTVLLFSLIFGSLVISSNYFPTVFAQTPEEIIDEIQETMGEVEDIGDVLDEAIKVDTMTALTLDLKERVNTLVDDEVLKQELVSILDLALFHLQEASNFVSRRAPMRRRWSRCSRPSRYGPILHSTRFSRIARRAAHSWS